MAEIRCVRAAPIRHEAHHGAAELRASVDVVAQLFSRQHRHECLLHVAAALINDQSAPLLHALRRLAVGRCRSAGGTSRSLS